MSRKHQGMRPFLLEVRKLMKGLTREALEEVVVSFAKECKPEDRESFRNLLRHGDTSSADVVEFSNDLMARVNKFIQRRHRGHRDEAVRPRLGSGFEWDLPLENRARKLNIYFNEAHKLFLAGEMAMARKIYEKLLSIFILDEEYGNAFGRSGLSTLYQGDIRETCSRYFRALYDAAPMERRAAALADAMRSFGLLYPTPPLFHDVIDAAEDPISDLEEFLPQWIQTLQERSVEGHRWGWVSIWDDLLAEAAIIHEGAEGAKKMAKRSGPHRAMAYLRWIETLLEENRRTEALEAAREALTQINYPRRTRAEIAGYLARLAAEKGDETLFKQNLREAFCSYPTLGRLIQLYKEARDDVQARKEIAWAAQQLEDISARVSDEFELDDRSQNLILLRARAFILARQIDQAIALAKQGNPLGWTFGLDPQGVVVPGMLISAAGFPSPSSAPYLYRVWASYPTPDEAEDDFKALFLQSLRKRPISIEERDRLFSLISPMIYARVSAILEGQKRESYRKAAHLVLAQKEAMIKLGRFREADKLTEQFSNKYTQASRFQKELRMAEAIESRHVSRADRLEQ